MNGDFDQPNLVLSCLNTRLFYSASSVPINNCVANSSGNDSNSCGQSVVARNMVGTTFTYFILSEVGKSNK